MHDVILMCIWLMSVCCKGCLFGVELHLHGAKAVYV